MLEKQGVIQFTDLDQYIGEPLWDVKKGCWRVLACYKRYNETREVIFTDSKSMESWNDVELTVKKAESILRGSK